jgi:hypothetical protein
MICVSLTAGDLLLLGRQAGLSIVARPVSACSLLCSDVVLSWVAVHAACPVSVLVFVVRCCLCLSCDDVILSRVAVHAACPELHAVCCYQLAT